MTDFSPAALHVFGEFNRAASGKPDDWHYLPAIAAALRAVANQMAAWADEEGRVDLDDLLDIAAELEGP